MIAQICTLAKIASLPVLICFDQIDNGGTDADSGDSPAQNIAKCIDKIYFQCSNVMLISCLTLEASRSIEQMGSGIPDRVFQRPVLAKPPNAEQMIELVKLRLDYFYKKNGLNSHDYPELYPFEKAKIKKAASESAGVRSLMKWCSEEFEKKVDTSPNPPEKKFLDIYHELIKKIQIPIKEDDKLAAIIACGMKMIPDGGTENVVINEVKTHIQQVIW